MERRKKVRTERTIRSVYNLFRFFKVKTERTLRSVLLYQNGNFFLTPTVRSSSAHAQLSSVEFVEDYEIKARR